MRIGTCQSSPGTIARGRLKVATYQGKAVNIPVAIAEGTRPGPTIFISAGMHGDEINGIELLQRFLHRFDAKKLAGTVIFLPVLNVPGFEAQQREVPYDSRDLNRSFGGHGTSLSHRIARTLMAEVVRRCLFGIDLHDSGTDAVLLPHSRVHPGCGGTKELGLLFGTEIILDRAGEKGMLAIESNRHHCLPVLTVEIGGAMIIWDRFLEEGLRGLTNILVAHQMLPGKVVLPRKQAFLKLRDAYPARVGGVINIKVRLGDFVHKRHLLAVIHDPVHEKNQGVYARECGIIFSLKRNGKIERGENALSILHLKTCTAHYTAAQKVEMRLNEPSTACLIRKNLFL